jgi:membrane protein DedA with SNARE-associated domain
MADWITNIVSSLGYLGIGLLMFLENLFPPIPSELIMPLAGFTIAQDQMEFTPAIASGIVGTVLGALPWYYLGVVYGERRLKRLINRRGKWIGVSNEDLDNSQGWFHRHGNSTVFFGRFIPAIRTVISLPAGLNEMSMIPFLIYSTLGTLIWVSFLTFAGYLLGENYQLVGQYLKPISIAVLVMIALGIGWWFWKRKG